MIPILRSIPHMYRWRNQTRIYRWYRALLVLERDLTRETDPQRRDQLRKRLDEIEAEVNKLKMPAFLANQFYGLREHISLVREMTEEKPPAKAA
jgi:CII-binding regulator of phage lambda lysogenization HflD